MTTINKSALVPYSAEQMYRLVDDIEKYADFLPWCGKATEISRDDNEVEASLFISHSGVNKAFTTRNKLYPHDKIDMQLVEGPFKKLHGTWQFTTLGDVGCKAELQLEFDFSSKVIGLTLGPVFSKIANNLVDAFIQRANQIYGNN